MLRGREHFLLCATFMGEVVRLLVVDGSELLTWMVSRIAPLGVEVERASSFSQAEKILSNNPPDAAIFNLSPCIPIWRNLIEACVQSVPIIPFLCTAAIDEESAYCSGVPCRQGDFISLDMTPIEFSQAVSFLIEEARCDRPKRFLANREAFDHNLKTAKNS